MRTIIMRVKDEDCEDLINYISEDIKDVWKYEKKDFEISETKMRTEEEIKEELARLKIEMDKYNQLALTEKDVKKSTEYYTKSHERGIRYWAIRWVMEWEEM